jgi:protoporphyrinogen/coproporphyrinogen III oxidase
VGNPGTKSIAILGAGITGLTTAYRLSRHGHRVRVFECSSRVGGAIRTEISEDWLVEAGPNSMMSSAPVDTLIDELGLASEKVNANPSAKNRFIVRGGSLVPVPLSPPALLRSALFSTGAKVRILAEMLARPRVRLGDISLAEFIRSHFGQEVVDYGLNPFVIGVYAGNPKKLSARYAFPKLWETEQKHGSLLRGQMAAAKSQTDETRSRIFSFRRGLQTLPDALAARLPAGALTFNAGIEALIPQASPNAVGNLSPTSGWSAHNARAGESGRDVREAGTWNVVWNDGAVTHTEPFDAVIAALPAPALAQLRLGTLGERPLASLEAIEHPPVSSVFLGYRREQVAHPLDGFGLLVPELEGRAILGVLFSSSLFDGRCPAGHVALTVLVGGTRDPEKARLSTDQLVAAIAPDLRALLGVSGEPVFQRHAFWPRAIPQYNLGYEIPLETIATTERAHRGLFIGGQARDGISLPSCIAAGERLAACVGRR